MANSSGHSMLLSVRHRGLVTVSAAAMILAALGERNAAYAQSESNAVEQIVVSSSRITRSGFDAPTPTQVVSAENLQDQAQPNVFTTINELPQLLGSASTATGTTSSSAGTDGLSIFNLRALGQTRTLTLIDGQRVVGTNTTQVVDISQIPQGLIQRVDVVTGGASASWGSDAVAGVVNIVLDKNFTGVKANVEGSVTTYGDGTDGLFQLTAGTGFDGGRGHIEVSGEFYRNDGVGPAVTRPWYNGNKILELTIPQTPAGQPQYTAAAHVGDELLAPGGIITAAGTSQTSSIVGTAFGPGGSPYPFLYGNPIENPWMVGGQPSADEAGIGADLASSMTRGALYGRVSYNITPDINVYATANYGTVLTSNVAFYSTYKPGNLTIQCDNPYLPAAIGAACGGAGHSVGFGTENADLPNIIVKNIRTQRRFVVGADGAFSFLGKDYTWSTYFEHGTTGVTNYNLNQTDTNLYNTALDAVRLANGSIVCRSAVAQSQGCQPFDVIGTGVGNSTAAQYFSGTAYMQTYLRQEAFSITANGEPFSLWAGPVSFATGFEYREEAFHQNADCASNGNCGNPLLSTAGNNWFSGNFHPSHGNFHVLEGFVETDVPLLDDADWGKSDVDLAGRATGYSTAGYVQTWKAGINYAPAFLDGIRFRALQSRDIRAPNLSELFGAPSTPTGGVVDDFAPNAGNTYIVHEPTISNLNLKPEKSQTTEVGIVLQPSWFPGFNSSLNYYRYAVKGEIGTVTAQQAMDLCFQGNQAQCANIQWSGTPFVTIPTYVTVQNFNLASVTTDGFDMEAAWARAMSDLPLLDSLHIPGTLTLQASANLVSKFITNTGIPNQPLFETAGMNTGSIPHWKGANTLKYENDTFSFFLTTRWISDGVNNRNYIQCTSGCPVPTINNPTINNNQIPGAFYLDIGGSYNITKPDDHLQVATYFAVDNVTNAAPPWDPLYGSLPISFGANPVLFDTLGRYYHIGVRFSAQ